MAITIPVTTQARVAPLNVPGAVRMDTSGSRIAAQQGAATVDALAAAQGRMQAQRDTTMIYDALALFGDAERQQNAKWQERRGAGAHGLQEEAVAWWDSEPAKFADGLENQQQRALFDQELAKRRNTNLDSLSRFQSQQEYAGLIDAANSRVSLEVSTAAANYADPDAVAVARQNTIDTVDTLVYMQHGGVVEKNILDAERLKALTKLHVGVVDNLNEVDPERANEYFKANKAEIDGTLHDDLKSKLETGETLTKAQTLVDDAWSAGLRGTALFDEIRKKASGKEEQEALAMARQRDGDAEAEQNRYRAERVDTLWGKFDEGGYRSLSPGDIEFLRKHDVRSLNTMRAMNPQDRIVTDWTQLRELESTARTDPATFATTELRAYRTGLATPQYEYLVKLQADVRKQLNGAAPGNVATTEQILSEQHRQLGWDSKDSEKSGLYDQRVREAIDAEQRATGKELNDTQKRAIATRMATQLTVPGLWSRDPRLFEIMGGTDLPRVAVPPEAHARVKQELQRIGRATDEDTVRRAYILMLQEGYFD